MGHGGVAMKTVLVTGATGFLGSHLCHGLLNSGYRIGIIKRQTSNLSRIQDIVTDLAVFDVDDGPEAPFKALGKVGAVIHAATSYGRQGETINEIFEANTAFPLRLLETAANYKTKSFINTDTVLGKFMNPYALAKHHCADWGRYFSATGKVGFTNVRLEHMYGPGDDASKFTTHVIRSCMENATELKLTPGEQRRDFIYIDDVVSGYMKLIALAEGSEIAFTQYDLGSGNAVSIRQFVETVRRITGSSTRLNFGAVPYRVNEVMNSEADTAPLLALGWRCKTSLEEGIVKTIQQENNP